ncbi:UNVERIFIED_CONTAM: hypothetical protein Sradi_2059500 [Sesamum radiatum]|uniref:Reverse transcriptase RNase H-like domain-containing protein n=1 Tax=Sesamum radiatum TaxID=300843 RepID=A0AAW2THW3_SESRA
MLKEKEHAIQDSRVGLGFTPLKPICIAINRVNNNYVVEGFSSTEDDKREENLKESIFNRLGPHRRIVHGASSKQFIFNRLGPCKRMGYQNACPKDDFPLAIAELMIDATTNHEALSFMDESSGYNQIQFQNLGTSVSSRVCSYQPRGTSLNCLLMKKDVPIEWDKACDKEFKSIKSYLMKPPVLVAPVPGCPLILYVAAQEFSVGILLAQKNDEGKENALYYLSRTMTPNELKYSPIEKLCLALILAIKKLKHYFQFHSIHLVSKANPLKYVMTKPVLLNRLARWYLQLQQFKITYVPQKAVKGQVLVDFLADHPMSTEWELFNDMTNEDVLVIEVTPPWKMYFDGASHKEGAGGGVVFVISEGEILPYSFTLT